jgi:hypothetical protein
LIHAYGNQPASNVSSSKSFLRRMPRAIGARRR